MYYDLTEKDCKNFPLINFQSEVGGYLEPLSVYQSKRILFQYLSANTKTQDLVGSKLYAVKLMLAICG